MYANLVGCCLRSEGLFNGCRYSGRKADSRGGMRRNHSFSCTFSRLGRARTSSALRSTYRKRSFLTARIRRQPFRRQNYEKFLKTRSSPAESRCKLAAVPTKNVGRPQGRPTRGIAMRMLRSNAARTRSRKNAFGETGYFCSDCSGSSSALTAFESSGSGSGCSNGVTSMSSTSNSNASLGPMSRPAPR